MLTEDTYAFAGDQGTYAVLPASPFPLMDILGVEGPNAGRSMPAIFELDGETLTICYQLGEGERPKALRSPAGTQVFLVRYQRVQ